MNQLQRHGFEAGRSQFIAVLTLALAMAVAWYSYAPGLGGSLHMDDRGNLAGLANVHDVTSALDFIAGGTAGPLGRPLALASFIPEAHAWPDLTDVFLRTNVLIHLLNGALVAWLLYLIGTTRGRPRDDAAITASMGAGLWLLLPILASSSLFIVQRMTSLSAVFVLLGGIAYLYSRAASARHRALALVGMTLALVFGAGLGVLAKENAILLFAFILAAETTLFERPVSLSRTRWRAWITVVLVAPCLVLLVYLVLRLPYSDTEVLRHGFNGMERLLTQAQILWEYIFRTLAPNPATLNPFQDDYSVQRFPLSPPAIAALLGWLLTIAGAITWRRKAPLFAFSVAWYLGGHVLESTTVPLELHFDHRNYLPLVGPMYALAASCMELHGSWRRLAVTGLGAYGILLAVVLLSVSSLWGRPLLAAEMWVIYKPASKRAALHLAGQLQQLDNDPHTARRVLHEALEYHPGAMDLRLQALTLSCNLSPESDHDAVAADLQDELATTQFSHGVFSGLMNLNTLAASGNCGNLDAPRIQQMAEQAISNPHFRGDPLVLHNLHVLVALTGIKRGDLDITLSNLESAQQAYFSISTLRFVVEVLRSAGLHELAMEFVVDAGSKRPQNPLRSIAWDREIDRLMTTLSPHDGSEAL